MWISKIELVCFKSYLQQIFEFPEPENGRNIVLIGGINGYGKTSILEALYLCLYGKDAMVHLARAGLNTDDARGYPTFLERAFNREALRDGRDTMTVRVVINKSKTKAVDIVHKWYFRPNGSWAVEEETVIRELERGIAQTPKIDGRNGFLLSEMLEELFVPAHIAPFFFFDGEEVKKLADQGRIEQIKQGLEGLLGVVLLRALADRLRGFENKKRSEVTTVDEENLTRLFETLTSNQQCLKELQKKASSILEEENILKAQRDSLVERITAAGGGGGDIATVKDLVEEREQFRNNLKDVRRKLEDVLAGRLPFHLVSKGILESFRNQIDAEIKFFSWEADKRSLEPRKLEFEAAFDLEKEPEIDPVLTHGQLVAIKARIDSAWASLFYPPPDDCAKEIIHDYLDDKSRLKVLDFFNGISLGQQEVQHLINEQHSVIQRIDELGRKINKLEGIDRDGTLPALRKELQEATTRLDKLSDDSRVDDRKIFALEAQVSSQKAEYERERKKLDDSSPVRALIEKSERVRKIIDSVIPALFPLKVKELAKAMTVVYKQLAHKDQISKILIKDDGSTIILGKSGIEITCDRSAGENQIFATALIAGLAKVSGVKAPLLVDTPLGRLDSKHRKNILRFWTEDKSRQVILLSQDEEINHRFYRQIADSICKSYLLEHVDVGDGIGRTTAKEDEYF